MGAKHVQSNNKEINFYQVLITLNNTISSKPNKNHPIASSKDNSQIGTLNLFG